MSKSFKEQHAFEKRTNEANRIKQKYPDRVPIIVEIDEKSNLPQIDKKKYLVPHDLTISQFIYVIRKRIKLHPEVPTTERLNIHYARMGEPTWNPNVLDATKWFKTHIDPEYKIHPVVSTMMPKNNIWLKTFI